MAYTTINKSTDYFNTKLYTGNVGTNNITGVGFKPDLVWTKNRQDNYNHSLFDAVRGVTKRMIANETSAEATVSASLTAFGSDGFSLGNDTTANASNTYVSWNWKANGQGSANTAGTLNTTYTSANTTNGISIITYTGNGVSSNGATIGHGLGVRPRVCLIKNLNLTNQNWEYFQDTKNNGKGGGATGFRLQLNNTQGNFGNNEMNFTNTTISLPSNDDAYNSSGKTYVCYAFTPITGFSTFGIYKGNSSSNGTFIYTGFKPAFVIIKNGSSNNTWLMLDNKRDSHNLFQNALFPSQNSTEAGTSSPGNYGMDFLSNGFKMKTSGNYNTNSNNSDNNEYTYMAFAEAPLVGTNNVPCTAR